MTRVSCGNRPVKPRMFHLTTSTWWRWDARCGTESARYLPLCQGLNFWRAAPMAGILSRYQACPLACLQETRTTVVHGVPDERRSHGGCGLGLRRHSCVLFRRRRRSASLGGCAACRVTVYRDRRKGWAVGLGPVPFQRIARAGVCNFVGVVVSCRFACRRVSGSAAAPAACSTGSSDVRKKPYS